jgi:hypothetical protein
MQPLITLRADIGKGFGQFTGALVMLIVTQGFKGSLEAAPSYAKCTPTAFPACHLAVDKMWRVLIGKFLVSSRIANVLLTSMTSRLWCRSSMHCSVLPTYNSRNTSLYLRCSTRCREGRRRRCGLYGWEARG